MLNHGLIHFLGPSNTFLAAQYCFSCFYFNFFGPETKKPVSRSGFINELCSCFITEMTVPGCSGVGTCSTNSASTATSARSTANAPTAACFTRCLRPSYNGPNASSTSCTAKEVGPDGFRLRKGIRRRRHSVDVCYGGAHLSLLRPHCLCLVMHCFTLVV